MINLLENKLNERKGNKMLKLKERSQLIFSVMLGC